MKDSKPKLCYVCEKRPVKVGDVCAECANQSTIMTKNIIGRAMGLTFFVDRTTRRPL